MAKTFVVLGATGGIGKAVSLKLKSEGANLILGARSQAALIALASELNCDFRTIDARSFLEVDSCFQAALERFGTVDGAVNCVGNVILKPAHLTSEEDFLQTISANLRTAFACVKAAGKVMRGTGGSVVLLSSAAARTGLPNHEAIAAAKAGVEGLCRSAAATYARQRIRFNCVAPGLVDTKMTAFISQNEKAKSSSLALHPLGRFGTPKDLDSIISWLLNDESDWVTGQVIGVDGGLSTLKVAVS